MHSSIVKRKQKKEQWLAFGISAIIMKTFSLSKGTLGFLERDYSLPKGEITLDKVLRSPQGKLNTRSRFDRVIHFLENCELNCLLTRSL